MGRDHSTARHRHRGVSMVTRLTSCNHKQTKADNPDLTINAATDDKYGEVMVSVRLDFEDGHSTIATMTVTKDVVLIAADAPVKVV